MLRPISQSLFSYTLAPIQSICRNHPTAVAMFATLFFASQVHAQPNNEGASAELLGRAAHWMGEDTALKVTAFVAILFTAIVLCVRFRKSTSLERTVSADREVHTAPTKRRDGKAPSSDPTDTRRKDVLNKGLPKPQSSSADAAADKTFQQRMAEGGVAETPGGVNITPYEMRENGIAALRKAIITPQRNALLSYTLAAHLMMLKKYKEAKEEGKGGYKYVESGKITGEIKTHLPLLIQQCSFLIEQPNATAFHKQKKEQQVPETPGLVNLPPEQMREKGIEELFKKFTPEQKGILYYIFAADLMCEGRFLEAKEETKRGVSFGKTIDLANQYQLCNQHIQLQQSQSAALSHVNSNNGLNGRSTVIKKPLPPIPQEEETEEPEVGTNAPPPPNTSFEDWEKQSKDAAPAEEPKISAPLNGKIHKIDPSSLPPPPQVVGNGPPPPTPSKLPPPPDVNPRPSAVEPRTTGKATTKEGVKGESTQAPKSMFDELTQRTKQEKGGLQTPAQTERPKVEDGAPNLLKEIEGTGKKALKPVSTPPTVARTKKKAELERMADEEAKKNPLYLKFKNARPAEEGDAGDDEDSFE